MSLAFEIAYGNLVAGFMLANKGWLSRVNTLAELPSGAEEGAVSMTYISGVTVAGITDGTMVTNNTDSTTVAAVLVDKQATVSLKPSQAASFYTKPENIRIIAERHSDALSADAQNALIADLIASTPLSGATKTLTIGQIDFVTDGTVSEAYDNLKNMAVVVALVQATNQGIPLEDMAIVMAPAAYANFIVLNATGISNATPVLQIDRMGGAMYSFMGVPVFVLSGATNFTGADKHAAFVTSRFGMILARKTPTLHGGGIIKASDGTSKLITIGPYAHAVITGTFGEILNPSS